MLSKEADEEAAGEVKRALDIRCGAPRHEFGMPVPYCTVRVVYEDAQRGSSEEVARSVCRVCGREPRVGGLALAPKTREGLLLQWFAEYQQHKRAGKSWRGFKGPLFRQACYILRVTRVKVWSSLVYRIQNHDLWTEGMKPCKRTSCIPLQSSALWHHQHALSPFPAISRLPIRRQPQQLSGHLVPATP